MKIWPISYPPHGLFSLTHSLHRGFFLSHYSDEHIVYLAKKDLRLTRDLASLQYLQFPLCCKSGNILALVYVKLKPKKIWNRLQSAVRKEMYEEDQNELRLNTVLEVSVRAFSYMRNRSIV